MKGKIELPIYIVQRKKNKRNSITFYDVCVTKEEAIHTFLEDHKSSDYFDSYVYELCARNFNLKIVPLSSETIWKAAYENVTTK